MTYASLTNWKYDNNLYHSVQSGPQRTGSNLNLTDTYLTVSSGYFWSAGNQQTTFGVNNEGADFGLVVAGPPNLSGYYSTEWRRVPPTVSGYWSDYENTYPHSSGVLTVYEGYRRQALISTANSTVQTAFRALSRV